MSQFLRKYGTACKVRIPVVKASSSDFSVSADWTPATGDVKVSKDGGNVANITTLPTAVGGTGSALWEFSLSATEMQAAEVSVQIVDSATKAVQDQAFSVVTFGNASAEMAMDFDDSVRGGLSALPNAAANATGGLLAGIIRGGTAQAGAASTITLDASASATDDFYNNNMIVLLSGTGAPACRIITDYVGSTKVATVDTAWSTNPSSDTVFAVVPLGLQGLTSAQVTTACQTAITNEGVSTFDAGSDGVLLSATAVDAIWDDAIENAETARQMLRLLRAALVGLASGLGTSTAVFKGEDESTTRITATVDSDGNRTAVTVNSA